MSQKSVDQATITSGLSETSDIVFHMKRHVQFPAELDYCNSLLYGTSKDNIHKLHIIQNMLVRIIYNLPLRSSTEQSLITLHWLPVHERIVYKVALFEYKCKNELALTYLSDLISNYGPPRQLRSSDMNLLVQPRVNTATASRAFSEAVLRIWNSLPMSIRATQNLNVFNLVFFSVKI